MRLPKQVHAAIVDAVFIFSRLPPFGITLRYHNHHGEITRRVREQGVRPRAYAAAEAGEA
jgi:hypothetical protein